MTIYVKSTFISSLYKHLTPKRWYEVDVTYINSGVMHTVIDDNGKKIQISLKGCYYLNWYDWKVKVK